MDPKGNAHQRRGQKVKKTKDWKRRQAELLGMPVGTAEKHLRKAIICELAKQLGKDTCHRCGNRIESPDDLAIIHVQNWEDDPSLYWALTNIAFSHTTCEATRPGKRQKEKKKMNLVQVLVETANNKPLVGTVHKGKLYVGGLKDQRYQIRVKNKSNNRVLIVPTVDGRNVLDGKSGSFDGSGLVLGPYQEHVFKGWRTSHEEVAAFRLGVKEDAYSSQKGSPENVGVIGIAVFKEKPRPSGSWTIDPWTTVIGGPRQNSLLRSVPTTSSTSGSSGLFTCDASAHTQQLGTEFGESLTDHVKETTFTRDSETPAEVHTLRYDSISALKKAGILKDRPVPQEPDAFPENSGFCDPPERSRWR